MSAWLPIMLFAAMVAAALAIVLRRPAVDARDARDVRLAVWRSRRAELDAEREGGILDDARYADAVRELEDAAALELDDAHAPPPTAPGRATRVATVIAVPAIALGLYAWLGTPVAPSSPDLTGLVAELEQRLAESPDDLQGQMLLGRSRVVLGDYAGAVRAWREAQRLAPSDPGVLANLAEALVLLDASALTGEAATLIEAVLEVDPDNPKALWYGGLAADARGDHALAAQRWRALLAQEPPAALQQVLTRRLATVEATPFELTVSVSLAPGLPMPDEGAFVFVTAHAQAGAPPLAALRVPLTAWPLELTLTERSAMIPGTDLGAHDALVLVARVSASGDAARAAGDLIGSARWIGGERIAVEIDEVVE